MDIDMVAGVVAFVAALVYVVRLEGRINTLTAIVDRVEAGVKLLNARYQFDGEYLTLHQRRAPSPIEPAE